MLNRFNVSMLVLDMRPGTIYFPHWMEFAISVGLVADALLVIWLAHRLLPIVHHEEEERKPRRIVRQVSEA